MRFDTLFLAIALGASSLPAAAEPASSATADLFAVVTSQVPLVPEPQDLALLLAGLGRMGQVVRRRRA